MSKSKSKNLDDILTIEKNVIVLCLLKQEYVLEVRFWRVTRCESQTTPCLPFYAFRRT